MSNPPSVRLTRRALFGAWPNFPRSPQSSYDALSACFHVQDERYCDGWATRTLAHDIADAVAAMAERAGSDAAQQLAVRRAALTLYYQAAEACDDSYGALGDVANEAITAYTANGWTTTGISAEVFWRDLLQWCVMASNYGLLHRLEAQLLARAGVGHDLDLVETILTDLTANYTTARMRWHAEQAQVLRAHAVVAAGALHRFEATAAAVGTSNWVAIDAMVDATVKRRRFDIAIGPLDAADGPGRHRDRLRQRRAELAATDG